MAENRPPRRKGRVIRAARAFSVALFGLLALPSYADLGAQARPRVAPPMRFVRVTSADPACKPNCPEWLSAEGRIEPGTAKAFADAVANLKGRRLPILIHSPGGSVPDAGAMGELIRAKGLAVAVARTLIANCPESLAEMSGRARHGRSPAGRPALRPACSCSPAGSNASPPHRRGSGCMRPPRW